MLVPDILYMCSITLVVHVQEQCARNILQVSVIKNKAGANNAMRAQVFRQFSTTFRGTTFIRGFNHSLY